MPKSYTVGIYQSLTVSIPSFSDADGHTLTIRAPAIKNIVGTTNTNYTFYDIDSEAKTITFNPRHCTNLGKFNFSISVIDG